MALFFNSNISSKYIRNNPIQITLQKYTRRQNTTRGVITDICLLMIFSKRKIGPRNFDTIHEILRYLSLAQSLLKGQNARMWCSGIWDGLKSIFYDLPRFLGKVYVCSLSPGRQLVATGPIFWNHTLRIDFDPNFGDIQRKFFLVFFSKFH